MTKTFWMLLVIVGFMVLGMAEILRAQTITDTAAYQGVFITHCSHASDSANKKALRRAFAASLPAQVISNMNQFCAWYDKAVAATITTPPPSTAEQSAFVNEIASQVQSTINQISTTNSKDAALLDGYVQSEKKHIGFASPQNPMDGSHVHGVQPDGISGSSIGYYWYTVDAVDQSHAYQDAVFYGTYAFGNGQCSYNSHLGEWMPYPGCSACGAGVPCHTPIITNNMAGSNNPPVHGGGVPPTSYISFETVAATPLVEGDNPNPSQVIAEGVAFELYCTAAAADLINYRFLGKHIYAFTKTKSVVPTVCAYVEANCTQATTPPLVDVQELIGCNPIFGDNRWTITPCSDDGTGHYGPGCSKAGFTYPASTALPGICTPWTPWY